MSETHWTPVTHENCRSIQGPFYHGTRATLALGAWLAPGHPSNYDKGRLLKHVYFSASQEPAIWASELAMAFAQSAGRGHIYVVEPTGVFEDDPNLTNRKFPGNPTRSYRTTAPLKVVGEIDDWQGHGEAAIQQMLNAIETLKQRGLAVIVD